MYAAKYILGRGAGLGVLVVLLVGSSAQAAVTISGGATKNMTCSGGTCSPMKQNAVLNVGDLQTMLASGDAAVTTTGTGVQAKDIIVSAELSWVSTGVLTLNSHRSITVDKPVSVMGHAGLVLATNDGGKKGELSFGPKGNVTFADLGSGLTINGASYMLVNTVQSLASAVAANPSGNYALAASYDASVDGVYSSSPVATNFLGSFEGLGNKVSHVTAMSEGNTGFFAAVEGGGQVRDFGLDRLKVEGHFHEIVYVGGLAAFSSGSIFRCYATGKVAGNIHARVGGLVGYNYGGNISQSYATVAVQSELGSAVGGLVGANVAGTISRSFANGSATDLHTGSEVGGLVGENQAAISDSYATGAVTGISDNVVGGGLIGNNVTASATIARSYSTGKVSGFVDASEGGLIGQDDTPSGSISNAYWDTDTSGITNLSQGAGNIANDPGITGLTTEQFQSGLPAGFDPKVWGENPTINGGFPYLLANPPA